MELHSEFATNKYLTKDGKIHQTQQWEQLTRMLNALGPGNEKTSKQWQTVWRDLKSNASKKAAKLRSERNRTGNFPMETERLDNLQQRIVACMGLQYVEGAHDCPDSTPEQEEYQLQLQDGNDDVLNIPPETTSIGEILNIERNADLDNDNDFEIMETSIINENDLTNNDVMQCLSNEDTITKSLTRPKKTTGKKMQQKKKEIYNKRSSQRISVELQQAREKFTEIAENHATAIQLFAEASKKQADAAMIQAENECARIALEKKIILQQERRLEIHEKLITTVDYMYRSMEKILFNYNTS